MDTIDVLTIVRHPFLLEVRNKPTIYKKRINNDRHTLTASPFRGYIRRQWM